MTRILIAYGTCEGHTGRIAKYLADVIGAQGYEVQAVNVERVGVGQPEGYDAVIVGASIHLGKHERCVVDYVRENRDILERRLPSAFFSVSLSAGEATEEARKAVGNCIEKFVKQTGWRPSMIGRFAGALLYTKYGFFKRWMMKRIARSKESPDLDTSRDYVYTDWHSVKHFADEFLGTLELARPGQHAGVGQS
jgi:menaquinone-dependent protoporphyrinogen oxidase